MDFWQIASAFADTGQNLKGPVSGSEGNEWGAPDIIATIAIIATVLAPILVLIIGLVIKQKRDRIKQQNDRSVRREREERKREREERKRKEAEDRYLQWLINRCVLNSADRDTLSSVEVRAEQKIFVSFNPGISLWGRRLKNKIFSLPEVLNLIDHKQTFGLVIVGESDSGKTTILQYLALTYAKHRQGKHLGRSKSLLPIFISLPEIAEFIRSVDRPSRSLADYTAGVCQEHGCTVDPSFFQKSYSAESASSYWIVWTR